MSELQLIEGAGYMHRVCLKYAEEGNYVRMVSCAQFPMALLIDNYRWLHEHGVLEETALAGWNAQTFTHGSQPWMRLFLGLSDREKLRAASEPLPEGDKFTVYRGTMDASKIKVAGKKIGGDKRCISWTLDPAVARKFASIGKIGGTVWATDVTRDDIYAYLGGEGNSHGYRPESEVLLILGKRHPIRVHGRVR